MTEIVKPIERHRFMCPLGGVQLHWSGSKVIRKITKSGNNNSKNSYLESTDLCYTADNTK